MNRFLGESQRSGHFLFHGSMHGDIELLEPRQAISYGEKDGRPAVCVAGMANFAVFMAIFSGRAWAGFGKRELRGSGFYVLDTDWQRAVSEGWTGFVYVLSKDSFEHYRGIEWRAYEPVRPLSVVEVGLDDLTETVHTYTRAELEAQQRDRQAASE